MSTTTDHQLQGTIVPRASAVRPIDPGVTIGHVQGIEYDFNEYKAKVTMRIDSRFDNLTAAFSTPTTLRYPPNQSSEAICEINWFTASGNFPGYILNDSYTSKVNFSKGLGE